MDIKTIAIVIIGIAVLIFLAGWIWYMRKTKNEEDQLFEDMEGQDFENYCAGRPLTQLVDRQIGY